MLQRILASLFFIVFLHSSLYAQDAWHSVTRLKDIGGLDMGGNPNVIPGDPKLYATTAEGVWVSSDRGETWQLFSQGLRDRQIRHIYKTTHGHWIALIGEPEGIRVSTDDGDSWIHEQSMQLLPVEELVEHPSGTLIVSIKDHVAMRSTDGGLTWAASNSGLPNGHWGLVLRLLVSGDILLSTGFNGQFGLYRTSDAGLTWSSSSTGIDGVQIRSIAQGFDGSVYAATATGGVYRSTDNGHSWQPNNTGLGQGSEDVESVIVANDGSVYAGTEGDGIFRSTDGTTWQHTGEGSGSFINRLAVAQDGYVYAGSGLNIVRSDISTGVNAVESLSERRILITPNPASDRIHLKGIADGDRVTIVDALGRVALSERLRDDGELAIGSLSTGTYILRAGDTQAILIKE